MKRIETVDVFRVLAIFAVMGLHTTECFGPNECGWVFNTAALFNQVERFAVPFFFMVSGYFWAEKCRVQSDFLPRSLSMCKRIMLIYIAWALIYAVVHSVKAIWLNGPTGPLKMVYWAIHGLNPAAFISVVLEGTKIHLWFLSALAIAVLISGALLSRGMGRALLVLSIVLFVIGLAGRAYADTPIGFHSRFSFRNGPFFSLIMFATGYALQRRSRELPSAWIGLAIALAGLTMQMFEVTWLRQQWGTNMSHDYVVGTYFLGLGVTLVALSNARSLRMPVLASVGPLVLGIYACHFLYVDLLRPIDDAYHGAPLWGVTYVTLVFLLSLVTAAGLSKLSITRRLVS